MSIRGIFRLMYLYDVAESIDLAALRSLLGERGGSAEASFPRRTPSYVRFEQAPVMEPAEVVTFGPGVKAACPVKYYGFGAVVVQVELPFDCADWKSLVEEAARWMEPPEVEPVVRALAKRRMDEIRPAVSKPAEVWLLESYLVTEIDEIRDEHGAHPAADDLIGKHSDELVQLTRGEVLRFAPKSIDETMQGSLSYYPNDLVIVGSHGAVVYDKPEDAAAVTQILEYAKMQLLEFRYYDTFLTHVLEEFYTALERPRNPLASRWSLPREAQRFNTIRLDVMELTERIDNAIKFVSDIYYARIYRLAATRMGVQDYRNLVDEKLATFGELYDSMIDRFNETRSFVIELLIAILAVFDVILLFRWH
jgi:hypothetical protein